MTDSPSPAEADFQEAYLSMVITPHGRRKVSPARREQRERMREDILAAAHKLIAESDVNSLTMRELGKQVGVTAATLYGYFPAKEAVLHALLEQKLAELDAAMREAARDTPPGIPRLLGFARGYRQFAMTHPDFYEMFIWKMETPDWDNLEADDNPDAAVLGMLHREIREAMERGELATMNIETLLRLLWAVGHGYVTLELTDCFGLEHVPPADREAEYLRHIATFLLSYARPGHDTLLRQLATGDGR